MAENIIIDFQVKDESLQPAIDKLEKLGLIDAKVATAFKQTNAELVKQATAVKNTSGAWGVLATNLGEVATEVKNTSTAFTQGFEQGVIDTLREAGVSLEQFLNALKEGPPAAAAGVQTVKAELRELTEQIARAKANGDDYGESYDALVLKAGSLKDAISDVNEEIKNTASDTSNFDGLIQVASGVAGAFSVAQGAVGLFGAENEELQETLLKVNSAMAIAQGLQQVQIVLQKESAATKLADVIVTKAQAAAHTLFNIVVGTSTGLLKAFRIALAATGVGLIVFALIELVQALTAVDNSLEDVNNELARNKALLESDVDAINKRTERELARARSVGAAESELIRIRGRSLLQQREAALAAQRELIVSRDAAEKMSEPWRLLNEQIETVGKTIDDIDQSLFIEQQNLIKQVAEETKEAADAATKASEDARAKRRAARDQELQDTIAGIERQLLAVEAGTQQELDLRKKLIVAKANLDLNAEQLTQNEIRLIQEQSFKDRQELQKEFDNKLRSDAIAAQISRNNAELSLIKTNNDDRLLLELSNIGLAAQLEIDAANGNATAIKEIIAKRDAAIRDTKKKFIEEAVEFEIALQSAQGGATSRALQRIANDERVKLQLRINAINELARIENEATDQRLVALQSEYDQRLISDKEYQLKYAQLQDQKKKVTQDTETQITDIQLKAQEERQRMMQETLRIVADAAQGVAFILDGLSQLQAEKDNLRLEAEKKRDEDLREAGAITEREFIARTKRMEQEEKKVRFEQARRDKNLAIFRAIINTSLAVTNAITTGDPYTAAIRAAIVAAIGAAEIAIISRRPLPAFAKGKKKGESYEGWGEVGEAGPELIERNGRLYLAPKRTIMHIKAQDVIYPAKQTKAMLEGKTHQVDRSQMQSKEIKGTEIDYEKLGAAYAKNQKTVSINIEKDFISEAVNNGLSKNNYFTKRYSSNI